jgi:hypothetical protein
MEQGSYRAGRFEGKEHYLLALLLIIVGSAAGVTLYSADSHSFLYFGDAASHMVRARQFVDSQRPGLENIGTVWLPLPHLILLPLAMIDPVFHSGLAGPIVGIPCLAAAGILLFLMVRQITGSNPAAFLSGCLFGLNPNMVYMALTPMNELVFIALAASGCYALLRWSGGDGEYWLWMTAIATVLASLCRYEGWLLVPFLSILAFAKTYSFWRSGRQAAALQAAAIAVLCWGGIGFWMGWNYVEYGDALTFARQTYTVAPGVAGDAGRQSALDALMLYGKALIVVFGPLLLVTAAMAWLSPRRPDSRGTGQGRFLIFLALPAVFALAALLAGFVQVDQWRWNWRYVLTASLLVAAGGGIGFSEFCRRVRSPAARDAVVAGLLAMPLIQLMLPSVGVATFDDARRSMTDNTRYAVALGSQMSGFSSGSTVALLTGNSQAQRIMISSRLPLKQFHIIYNPAEPGILESPAAAERYIVIGKDLTPESEGFVRSWLSRKPEWLRSFTILGENNHFILLERTAPPPASPRR